MKTKRILVIVTITIILIPSVSFAFFTIGGYDIAVQLKILAENVEQTLHLKDIISFTKKQVQDVKKTLDIVKDVNRDINEIKNYNTDRLINDIEDITVGNVEEDITDLSSYITDKRYLDGDDSGRIKGFFRYVWGEEPEAPDSPIKVKMFANNYFAVKSFEDVNESYDFTYNIRKLYHNVIDDVKGAAPGKSEQIGAQLQAVNTLQLANLQDNQAGQTKLAAIDMMNRASEARTAQQQTVYMFSSVSDVLKKMKEEQKE